MCCISYASSAVQEQLLLFYFMKALCIAYLFNTFEGRHYDAMALFGECMGLKQHRVVVFQSMPFKVALARTRMHNTIGQWF